MGRIRSRGRILGGSPGRGRRGYARFEIVFLDVLDSLDALSLRFPMFGGLGRSELTFSNVSGPPTLSLDACAAKRAQPVWCHLGVGGDFVGPGPGGEPLKEGNSILDSDIGQWTVTVYSNRPHSRVPHKGAGGYMYRYA